MKFITRYQFFFSSFLFVQIKVVSPISTVLMPHRERQREMEREREGESILPQVFVAISALIK